VSDADADRPIHAVAFGASTGGLEALLEIMPALPARMGAAVFVVVHVPPDHPSVLAAVLDRQCAMPVAAAIDGEAVVPDRVYVAPPNHHLVVEPGPRIALSDHDRVNFSRPSVDVLFSSAATVFGPHLVAVVLSGGNRDGADGVAAVVRAGGRVVVQHPGDAQVPVMTWAALDQAPADLVLPAADIARLLSGIRGAGS
jgi:two-component system, chemotaxis family, protein-glutamate methylesterase/glutaminase